jgi:UDP-N-acetylglucosamine:LPS N-acetylglucosamine transferase
MSLKDLVVACGKQNTLATGVLTITNTNIGAGDVCVASFSTAVGSASAATQLRGICSAGACTITAVDAAGAAVGVIVGVSYFILKPQALGFGSA